MFKLETDPVERQHLTTLREERRQQTLEHELVHVVLNSHLGIHARDLPLWFHEGCAVTFSGQPGSQTERRQGP